MRRFIRWLALGLVVCVLGVVAFVAITNKPPEPMARLYTTEVPSYHLERVECVDGREVDYYQRDDGRPYGAGELTDRPCAMR